MNAATTLWKQLGTKVAENSAPWWNSKAPVATLDKEVWQMAAEDAPINYTVFAGGNHMYTWSFAYNIDAIRGWIFAQSKDAAKEPPRSHDGDNPLRKGGHDAARALLDEGLRYYRGTDGVTQDYAKAFALFKEGTEKGHMKAPRYVGMMYRDGQYVKQSDKEAARYFQIAADRGDVTGTDYLGEIYASGCGVKKDYAKAMELFQKAAAHGGTVGAPAMVDIGKLYLDGCGVPKDEALAQFWFEKARATGYTFDTPTGA